MVTQRPGPAPFPAGCVSESRVPGRDGVSLGLGVLRPQRPWALPPQHLPAAATPARAPPWEAFQAWRGEMCALRLRHCACVS